MWQNNDKIMNLLEVADKKKFRVPFKCPVCGDESAHVFFYKFDAEDTAGPAWSWCSRCNSYSHVRYRIPEWWKNLCSLDEDELCSTPEYLEKNKTIIDSHLDSIISSNNIGQA